ncbi:hypothetical protein ACFUAC_02835 [Streptomyces sp. NPDC057148]|uniref:hypothetical protein n=1 Tax=unclassified Streptomyces TaxID=2593676 RepID=UPI00363070E5
MSKRISDAGPFAGHRCAARQAVTEEPQEKVRRHVAEAVDSALAGFPGPDGAASRS